jgi:acetoin utilization deacetylase AcuC-like enzyme
MQNIPVFFTDLMVAPDQGASPSAHKPKHVVQDWIEEGFPIELRVPPPCSREQLAVAHDRAYVDAVLDLKQRNGFGNRSAEVAAALPYTNGAMLAAAREAIDNGKVAVAPVSGFHHACHDMGGGFCTFNGLMVAALCLHAEGVAKRVGVLDFDQHYGNGTDDIIDTLQVDWLVHYTAGSQWRRPQQATEFLNAIDDIVASMRGCEVVLCQAGADPHINDPLGGWLTTAQLLERDLAVFRSLGRLGIPVAWNLAGGYQRTEDGGIEPVLAIHRNTMRACANVYCSEGVSI